MAEGTTYSAPAPGTAPSHDFFVASTVNVAILHAAKELTPADKRSPRPTLYQVLDRAWELVRDARASNSQNLVLRDAEYYLLCRRNTADSGGTLSAIGNAAFWTAAGAAHNVMKLGAILAGLEEGLRADPDQVSSPPGASSVVWCGRGSTHGVKDVGSSAAGPRLLNPATLELIGGPPATREKAPPSTTPLG